MKTDNSNIVVDQLEIQRNKMKQWNDKRAESEKKGIEKFYLLKETFKKQKTQ